ncbi:Mic19p [Sugiyamaella lignohabitans]|uniref:Mic19p n=1 Tax=Sugiyamaella lignohabitans TaxID=796027 RepID=A0A167EML8_9ASCO|nr:Mic19p [Sugiyamaella lignohabitans]ANB14259.1 Mic19p [Sugiyamaella lignohabitans]
MGNSSSKPAEQVKVFLPSTPTELSPSLLGKLESSLESDYTRAQYTEKHIQDRVSEELKKIQKESEAEFKSLASKVSEISEEKLGDIDSAKLHAKLDELKSALEARQKRGKFDKEITAARDALATCFKENKGKPLKCQEVFEEFHRKVEALSS